MKQICPREILSANGKFEKETYVRPNVSDLQSSKYDQNYLQEYLNDKNSWNGRIDRWNGNSYLFASMDSISNFTKVTFVSTRNGTILQSTAKLRSMINLILGFRLCMSNLSRWNSQTCRTSDLCS